MVENRTHLFDGDAREPLDKLSDLYPVFKVFKESCDRDAGPAKYPPPHLRVVGHARPLGKTTNLT